MHWFRGLHQHSVLMTRYFTVKIMYYSVLVNRSFYNAAGFEHRSAVIY